MRFILLPVVIAFAGAGGCQPANSVDPASDAKAEISDEAPAIASNSSPSAFPDVDWAKAVRIAHPELRWQAPMPSEDGSSVALVFGKAYGDWVEAEVTCDAAGGLTFHKLDTSLTPLAPHEAILRAGDAIVEGSGNSSEVWEMGDIVDLAIGPIKDRPFVEKFGDGADLAFLTRLAGTTEWSGATYVGNPTAMGDFAARCEALRSDLR